MRIITIDNGNSNPHVGIFHQATLLEVLPLKDYTKEQDDFILISNVGKEIEILPSLDLNQFRIPTNEDSFTFLGMPVHYSLSLGDDRLLCAHYLFKRGLSSIDRILCIDAGTFLTADLITNDGFMGGFIFPGINTMRSSYQRGERLGNHLPNQDFLKELAHFPHTTEEAIAGALEIYLLSICERVTKTTRPSAIVITGGHASIVQSIFLKLNLGFPLDLNPHLVHLALAKIAQSHLGKVE